MKKLNLLLMVLLVSALVFVACDSSQKPQETIGETTAEETTAEETTEAHVCSFGEWKTTKEATCTEDGEQERACACGEKETQSLDMIPHTETIDAAVNPTCTETGLTEGKHCSVCETVHVAQETGAALGHTEVIDAAVAPTYTTKGKTAGSHCATCNTIFHKQNNIATIWSGNKIQPTKLVKIDGVYYYEINSAEELAFLLTAPEEWAKYNYSLNCDIWLNAEELIFSQEGMLLNPGALNFWDGFICEKFNGNNHNIKGVYSGKGLIIDCSEVKNLNVLNSYIQGDGRTTIGGICAGADYVYSCSFNGVVYDPFGSTSAMSLYEHSVGGIVGYLRGKISNCINYGKIINEDTFLNIGGIVGYATWYPATNCINYGDIISSADYFDPNGHRRGIGGVVGCGKANNCYNYGNITGAGWIGGIVGLLNSETYNCINYGSVLGHTSGYYAGGIAGYLAGKTINCINYGMVSGGNYVGGISGYADNQIINCNNVNEVNGISNVGGIVGFLDIFDDNSSVLSCYYLKNDSINFSLNGIGNLADEIGSCEAKDDAFFNEDK